MKKLITILIMVAAMNVSGQWAHLNFIEGGYVKTIMRDSSRFIYVATNNSYQIYRSANNGNSWRLFTNDFPYFQIQNMMSTKNAIFAATFGGGVLKSINHGLNWVQYNNGITTEYAMSFAMNDEYIFAGTQNGVYRSSNEGAVWEYVNSGIGFTHGVHAMVVQDSVIFAATSIGSPGYMYRTTNNGLNWTLINNGLPLFYATQLSKCGNRVFSIGGDEKLYATSNYGDNWNAVSLPQNSYVHTMTAKGDTLISSLSGIINKLYITTNGGVDWTLINSASQYYTNCITILSNRLISTNNYSIYRSTDFGNNWSAVNKGFTDVEILAVTAKDNNVIAGTNGHGVFKSTNYGISWNMVQSLDSHSTINNFTWQGNSLYTNYGTRIMRSTDFGSTFFQQGNTPPSITYSSPFAIKNDIFIGGFSSSGIYRSTNAGFNWTLSLSGLPTYIFSVPIIFFRDTTCFAFASEAPFEGNLFYSNNYGLTWDSVSNSGIWRSPSCVNYSTAHNKIYLGYSGVYVSTNSGFNFHFSLTVILYIPV
ncbi:MAG: hypothetical protein NTU73_13580 [Ignavibacteriae bacterium]|nr:hypothetical protein [Ignavibacteriota bacterium]